MFFCAGNKWVENTKVSPAFWEAATGENRTPRPLPTVTYSIVSVQLRKSTNISRKTRTLSQCLIVLSYQLQGIWVLCHSHLLFLHSPHLLFKDLIFLSLAQPFLAALLTCSCSGKFDLRLTDWTILSVWKLNSYQVLHWHSAIRWSRWKASAGWCDRVDWVLTGLSCLIVEIWNIYFWRTQPWAWQLCLLHISLFCLRGDKNLFVETQNWIGLKVLLNPPRHV